VFPKQEKLVKLGGIMESVVFLCILGNVILGTILSECTKTFPEDMYKISDSCVSQFMNEVLQHFIGQ
jgi:hypothetical protein